MFLPAKSAPYFPRSPTWSLPFIHHQPPLATKEIGKHACSLREESKYLLVRKRGDGTEWAMGSLCPAWKAGFILNKLHLKCRSDILMETPDRDQRIVWNSGVSDQGLNI